VCEGMRSGVRSKYGPRLFRHGHCERSPRRMGRAKRNPSRFLPRGSMMGFASALPILRFRGHGFASSRRISPELCLIASPSIGKGRREDRAPAGTRGPLCEGCATRSCTAAYRCSQDSPAFPAQWLYGLCRALPGERCAIAPVALWMADALARLS